MKTDRQKSYEKPAMERGQNLKTFKPYPIPTPTDKTSRRHNVRHNKNQGFRKGRTLPTVLTVAEIDNLLNMPDDWTNKGTRDRAMLELMYATGLRVSELVNLKLSALDIDGRTVRVLGKGNKERVVPIVTTALERVKEYLAKARPLGDSPWLFPGQPASVSGVPGKPLSRQTFWRMIKGYAKKAGIKTEVSPHVLRHSFATHLVQNNAGLPHVQKLLGHSNITTTMIYTHLADADLQMAVDQHHPRGKYDGK